MPALLACFYYEKKRNEAEESEREDNTIKTCGADADAKLLRAKEHEEESRRKNTSQSFKNENDGK